MAWYFREAAYSNSPENWDKYTNNVSALTCSPCYKTQFCDSRLIKSPRLLILLLEI